MGTPDFAAPSLNSLLIPADLKILAVFTQADKKVGRKQTITSPIIKKIAQQNSIPVYQPLKIKTELERIRKLKPDLIVVVAYGQIIPQVILDIPQYACINVHASLLPKYRGAACLNAPILNGDSETGLTIMRMEAGLDTGPILKQIKISLNKQETFSSLHDKLAKLAAKILVPTLHDLIDDKLEEIPQNEEKASYVGLIKKEAGKIDWHKSASEIERMIRALNPWPGTYSKNNNKIIKITVSENEIVKINTYKIGEVFYVNNKLVVQCGQDALVILRLQTEGKRELSAPEFLNGNQNFIGTIFS